MNYVSKLTHEQILELMHIYAPNYIEIDYTVNEKFISVVLRDHEGFEESYAIRDYDVNIYSWMGNEYDYLVKFRVKMLEYFGDEYARDYLLG